MRRSLLASGTAIASGVWAAWRARPRGTLPNPPPGERDPAGLRGTLPNPPPGERDPAGPRGTPRDSAELHEVPPTPRIETAPGACPGPCRCDGARQAVGRRSAGGAPGGVVCAVRAGDLAAAGVATGHRREVVPGAAAIRGALQATAAGRTRDRTVPGLGRAGDAVGVEGGVGHGGLSSLSDGPAVGRSGLTDRDRIRGEPDRARLDRRARCPNRHRTGCDLVSPSRRGPPRARPPASAAPAAWAGSPPGVPESPGGRSGASWPDLVGRIPVDPEVETHLLPVGQGGGASRWSTGRRR